MCVSLGLSEWKDQGPRSSSTQGTFVDPWHRWVYRLCGRDRDRAVHTTTYRINSRRFPRFGLCVFRSFTSTPASPPTLHRAPHQAGRPARGRLGGGCDDAARGAAAECGVRDPALDEGLELGAEVGHVEGVFADDRGRGVGGLAAVPAEAVCGPAAGVSRGTESGEGRRRTCCVCGADALDDEPDGVCEADGVVRGVGWRRGG